ncbi:MAG: hypothetical protein ACAH24_01100 [Hyphomicrobiaceae bacterium]
MSTSRKLLAQVRRALCAAFALAGFASLLQLALPFYALHIFESAIPAANLQTVALLALAAACAGAVLIAVVAARDRIVLRAGLWLDHTLGAHILAGGARLGAPSAEIAGNSAALARLARALTDRTIVAALDAPWSPLMLLALALLSPILAAVAAGFAALLVLVTFAQARKVGRLVAREADAAVRVSQWWAATVSGSSERPLQTDAPGQWERLNRTRIAAAYALSRRGAILGDVAGLVKFAAQIALIAAGAWLVATQALTPAALFAAVLINAALLDPLQRLVVSLPAVRSAMGAYRQLRALPADADEGAEAVHAASGPGAAPQPQRLNVRGPLAAGFAAVLLFAVAALGTAYAGLGDLAGLTGGAIFETRLTPLHFSKLGAGARVHVREGATVKAGDVIITRDTTEVDRQIVMLKALSEAARAQLALIGREASGVMAPADKPTVASLEQRVAELEKETQELMSRIARAEQELAKSEIRAPVSGRVVALSTRPAESPEAGGAVDLQIATADRSLLERLFDPLRRGVRAAFAPQLTPNERGTP